MINTLAFDNFKGNPTKIEFIYRTVIDTAKIISNNKKFTNFVYSMIVYGILFEYLKDATNISIEFNYCNFYIKICFNNDYISIIYNINVTNKYTLYSTNNKLSIYTSKILSHQFQTKVYQAIEEILKCQQ